MRQFQELVTFGLSLQDEHFQSGALSRQVYENTLLHVQQHSAQFRDDFSCSLNTLNIDQYLTYSMNMKSHLETARCAAAHAVMYSHILGEITRHSENAHPVEITRRSQVPEIAA